MRIRLRARDGSRVGRGVRVVTVLVLLAIALSGAKRQASRPAPAQPSTAAAPVAELTSPAAAVTYHDRTLFVLHARLGPYSASDRARAIMERLLASDEKRGNRPPTVQVVEEGDHSTIVLDGVPLTSVTNADAEAAGEARPVLARSEADAVRQALDAYRNSVSLPRLLLSAFYALLLTGGLIAVFWLFGRYEPQLEDRVRRLERRIPALRIQSVELVSSRRMVAVAAGLLRILRWLVSALLLYFYLAAVLSLFPRTQGLAPILLSYVLNPIRQLGQAVLDYIPDLLVIAVAIFFTRLVLRFARLIFTEIGRGTIRFSGFYPEWAQPTYKIVRVLILAILAVVIFPYLPGSKSPAFQGISIFLGVLLSLGSGSSIANIISGVVLTYTRAFQIGDRVKIGDTTGDVLERTLLMTRVRTIKNEEVGIPNSLVMTSAVINYSNGGRDEGLILYTSVTIGYDAPWRTIHALLIGAAREVSGIEANPAPFVLQTALDDFYVSYQINAFTRIPREMARIYSDLHQQIQDKFNEAGMEIMSPHYSSLRDGNTIAIPEKYHPEGYRRPGFAVEEVKGEDGGGKGRQEVSKGVKPSGPGGE